MQTSLVSYVQEPFENPHFPQCNCNKSRPGHKYLVSPSGPSSCYKANKWLKNVKLPVNPSGVYSQLLFLSHSVTVDSLLLLDASRTFKTVDYFTNGGEEVLIRVLHCLSAYCPNLGYVQGMNYLAGTLLWHCTEVDSFWLFIGLLEDFELRDNFKQGFPGLKKHFHVMDFLVSFHYRLVFSHFHDLGVSIQMFSTDWVLTIFSNSVPIEMSKYVFSKFFKHGWNFVYKLFLEIIGRLERKILGSSRFSDIINLFKPPQGNKGWKVFIKSLERSKESVSWKKVVKAANKVQIDEWFLRCMKHNSSNIAESP